MFRKFAVSAVLLTCLSMVASAQNASAVIGNASKALGADSLTSITYSGSAQNANFGQSKNIATPWAPTGITRITTYTRTIDFGAPASRAFGPTQPPQLPGFPAVTPGNFNQNITPAQNNWTAQSEIWLTPWGFLKGAAAMNATVRQQGGRQVVSFSPATKAPSGASYVVTGYINNQNLVEKVETRVEHPVMGDLLVEAEYSDYRDANGLKYPARIVQKRGGMQTFEANITAASANPTNLTELMTPPPAPGRGGAPGGGAPGGAPAAGGAAQGARAGGPPPPPVVEKLELAPGVYRITGGYTSIAIDMGDHIVVLESGQSEARGLAVMAAAKEAIPGKPIRFVVNTHAHFDHASGVATAVAEGATIITHNNNKDFWEKALSAPRTLVGDSLAKANRRPNVEGVGDRRTLKGSNGKVVELYGVQGLEHSDGMLMAYLPAEKVLFTADFNVPGANQPVSPNNAVLVRNVERLKLDFDRHVLVHAPNPDRLLTRADTMAWSTAGTN